MKKLFTTFMLFVALCFIAVRSYGQELTVLETDDPLNTIILRDTAADGSRLHTDYILKRDGYYILSGSISANGFNLTIKGEEGAGERPVIILGTDANGDRLGWQLISCTNNITLKNLKIINASDNGTRGWNSGILPSGLNAVITVDNCIIDFNDGAFIYNENSANGQSYEFTNNLFRYNGVVEWGGPWSGFGLIIKNENVQRMIFENNTVVDAIAPFLVFFNGNLNNFWFNHNTIVNHAQFLFRSEFWINAIVMNNLFVNAHFVGESDQLRVGQDWDTLAYGVITVDKTDTIPWEGFPAENDRVFMLAYNNNFVSPEIKSWWETAAVDFDTVDYQVADVSVANGFFNSRALSMMHDDVNYPKFLWDDSLSILKLDPSIQGYNSDFPEMIKFARTLLGQKDLGALNWAKHPDGDPKIPVADDFFSFEYSNEVLQKSAYRGYPVGDLNWFPSAKAQWDADADKETYESILEKANNGTWLFENQTTTAIPSNSVSITKLYPNPVKSEIQLSFTSTQAGLVTVKIYDLFGRIVATPVDEMLAAGEHQTIIDVSGLSDGTYVFQLRTANGFLTRKITVCR